MAPLFSEQGRKRWYYLPLASTCRFACSYCQNTPRLSVEERSYESLAESFRKAKAANYAALVIPCNSWFRKDLRSLRALHDQFEIPLLVEWNERFLRETLGAPPELSDFSFCAGFIFTGENFTNADFSLMAESAGGRPYWIRWLGTKTGIANLKKLSPLPEQLQKKLFLEALIPREKNQGLLEPQEIYHELEQISQASAGWRPQPLPGLDAHEPLIDHFRNLEPEIKPLISIKPSPEVTPRVSVILPSYNNRRYLVNTLKHLANQDLPKRDFEIIVVDDGSDDDSQVAVKSLVDSWGNSLAFTYLFFPRLKPRKMGDHQFRAGVARNLGVKHSQAPLLVFLDSDILTPPHYLRALLETHQQFDLVQTRRVQLRREVSSEFTRYEEIMVGRDTYVTDEGYWENFQRSTNDWNRTERKWRFVCTYGLSLKRELFEKVGWIRKNYTFYGYEDTELGWDLAQMGARFHLSPLQVYHLDHRQERSEFENSHQRKLLLLQNSALTFYYNTLAPEVFEHLQWLFQPALSWRIRVASLLKKLAIPKPLIARIGGISQRTITFLVFSKNGLWRSSYPLRKIYYFSAYQWTKRINRERA